MEVEKKIGFSLQKMAQNNQLLQNVLHLFKYNTKPIPNCQKKTLFIIRLIIKAFKKIHTYSLVWVKSQQNTVL